MIRLLKLRSCYYLIIALHAMISNTQAAPQFKLVPLQTVLKKNKNITYTKCCDSIPFSFESFPYSHNRTTHQPSQGTFDELFILNIPNGRACSANGWVLVNDKVITELIWKDTDINHRKFNKTDFSNLAHVPGKVAVLAQRGVDCYYHWLGEVLGRLALLEMQGIEYDWLYVPLHKPFMKATLELWGVDFNKLIDTADETAYIQADELIVPSLVTNIAGEYTKYSSYNHPQILEYVKNKLLSRALSCNIDTSNLHHKIFISRQDTRLRRIINEDDLFALLETKGFKRYTLANMPIAEQILLFYFAQQIIAPHGAGLINIMFCQPETEFIEILQERGDSTYWYMAQMFGLKKRCIQTVPFSPTNGTADTIIDLEIIQTLIKDI